MRELAQVGEREVPFNAFPALTATCHCGAIKVLVPREPESVTDCNCSICRRYGVLWAYYKDAEVTLTAAPDATDDYARGDKSLKFIRCKHCGCLLPAPLFPTQQHGRCAQRSAYPLRRLDGADTWEYIG